MSALPELQDVEESFWKERHPDHDNFHGFTKNGKPSCRVIPAEAGIQSSETAASFLDFGFHRGAALLRRHQLLGRV
jgi:hypothetical protein